MQNLNRSENPLSVLIKNASTILSSLPFIDPEQRKGAAIQTKNPCGPHAGDIFRLANLDFTERGTRFYETPQCRATLSIPDIGFDFYDSTRRHTSSN
ncbi:hypothetical protein ABKN59_004315 [Abortiporus biennis]